MIRHNIRIFFILLIIFLMVGCNANQREVIVYTSVDQVYSEPFFKRFEDETGIKVLANYDVEASKTTGLVTRLISEKPNPVADVFWNGEFSQTIHLKDEGVLQPYSSSASDGINPNYIDPEGYWTAFGGRARVFIVNTNNLKKEDYPNSIFDLTNNKEKGSQIAMANPLFGTTATHAASLYAYLGNQDVKAYYKAIKDQNIRIVSGNAMVRDLVGDGAIKFGITDTDDAIGAIKKGKPVAIIFPDQGPNDIGTLVIPNSVALIKGAQHSEEAKLFIDYLLSKESEEYLIKTGWCQMASRDVKVTNPYFDINKIKTMDINLETIYRSLLDSQEDLKVLFME